MSTTRNFKWQSRFSTKESLRVTSKPSKKRSKFWQNSIIQTLSSTMRPISMKNIFISSWSISTVENYSRKLPNNKIRCFQKKWRICTWGNFLVRYVICTLKALSIEILRQKTSCLLKMMSLSWSISASPRDSKETKSWGPSLVHHITWLPRFYKDNMIQNVTHGL